MPRVPLCLTTICLTLAAAFACPAAMGGEVGEVVFAAGSASVQADGIPHAARKGLRVEEGATLKTGGNGYLYLRTDDGGFFILRPNSTGRVMVYHYDTSHPKDSQIKIELEHGVARVISGNAAKEARERFRMNTPVAAIGVKGTDFSVFTDANETRVSVQSGAIVVSGFSDDCAPTGNGPCGGDNTKILASSAAPVILRVQRDDTEPKLIHSEGLLPDQVMPPGPDEPSESSNSSRASEVKKESNLDQESVITDSGKPLPPPRPLLSWGRWQAIADLPANTNLSEMTKNGYELIAAGNPFALFRDTHATTTLPASGMVRFKLDAHEGYFHDNTTGSDFASQASDGMLAIDFTDRTFTTSLDLSGGGVSSQFHTRGRIEPNGRLQSDYLRPYASGTVGGTAAQEAAYIYHHRVNGNITADGVAHWVR